MTSYSAEEGGPCLARRDRLGLCRMFEELGPEAPTLCQGWTARDLAAHLVARDRRPDSVPGLVVPALEGWSERVRHRERARPYEELVELLRHGPPRWSPLRRPAGDRAFNTHEYFVHYEDVRRAQPGWEPRPLEASDDADLWRVLGWFGPRAFRRVPVAVELRRPDGTTRWVHRPRRVRPAGRGGAGDISGRADGGRPSAVTILGPPGELLLYAFGRRDQARVELEGDAVAVGGLQSTRLSW